MAKTWDQFHLGIGKAAVAVRSVALFNSTSGAPCWRVRCTRSIGGTNPPVHRLVLNVLRCLGLHALITAARNEDRTAARTPSALTIRIQFIGDKLGASGITHRPHLRGVDAVTRNKLLRKGAEIVTVGVKVFPPGNAVTGCIFIWRHDGYKNHVAGICDTAHSGEHALLRAVNLRLVVTPIVAVNVEDYAHGF